MDKKVIITGVSSFIGCHLAQKFSQNGFSVIGTLSQNPESYSGIQKQRLEVLQNHCELEVLDFTNSSQLADFLQKHQDLSYFIHHAGYATQYGSLDYDVKKAFEVNVLPLSDLFLQLSKTDCQGIVVTGSSAEYSDSDSANSENDKCQPTMPYGLSKLCETLSAMQLSKRYNLPLRVARVYIPFGVLDNEKKLMPYVVNMLKQGKEVELSPCEQSRDFLSVEDLCAGYLALVDDLQNGGAEVFNICSGKATLLKDFLLLIAQELNVDKTLLKFGAKPMRAGETLFSFGNCDKIKTRLNWQPKSLQQAIQNYLQQMAKEIS